MSLMGSRLPSNNQVGHESAICDMHDAVARDYYALVLVRRCVLSFSIF